MNLDAADAKLRKRGLGPVVWVAIAITASLVCWLLLVRGGGVFGRLWNQASAEFACPAPGTVFVMSTPLSLSPEPGFQTPVMIGERDGFDCHTLSAARGVYWLHAGLTGSPEVEWRAAEEALWPLKVDNRSHAHFETKGHTWAVDYRVVSFGKLTARVGTYEAFKIDGSLTMDGKIVYATENWWAPALRYTLSFRLNRYTAGDSNVFWEIAAVSGRNS